ncbi:MAG: hypothetical protein BM560_07675 [Roseobacter sp. MedPE-SWde]|uniref:hypothetical protein n=1 Tax=Roseobacter sp. MED193 TaxID=314262 RepID=UPI000326CC1E|nr:hypothetical protein [Roseobacter sp. MED193]OIQ42303.1 MAG: hypothetical protein BM560_07675 [Roseobacter sp. MedPE-SWde]
MRLLLILLAFLTSLPQTGRAIEPMGAEEFDRYTQGKTLFYGFDGTAYGVERYLPGRRVIWSFLDGRCQEGIWYEEAGQICFVYEDNSQPQCWSFMLTPEGLNARFQNDPQATELYESGDVDDEMICLGPEVGV